MLPYLPVTGYMAPEMLVQRAQPRHLRKGYTQGVDWWSLGATVYKMFTGLRPFSKAELKACVEDRENTAGLAPLLKQLRFPVSASNAASDVFLGCWRAMCASGLAAHLTCSQLSR